MGSWGTGIGENDFVRDVLGILEDHIKDGNSVAKASRLVQQRFAADINQADPLFWLALADAQWRYGDLDKAVVKHVNEIVDNDIEMDLWGGPGDKTYEQRKAALQAFRVKIASPNPKPKPLPKRIKRPPKYQPGDCLSINLENGQYGAVLVLNIDSSNLEHGMDLLAELDYLSDTPPTLETFGQRRWLTMQHLGEPQRKLICWYHPDGYRAIKKRITLLGKIAILTSDPQDSAIHMGWKNIGTHILLQQQWQAENARGGTA